MLFNLSRRSFFKSVATASALGMAGCATAPRAFKGKIRLAAVGIWGKGFSDWMPMVKDPRVELVAFCDADKGTLAKVKANKDFMKLGIDADKIPFYTDYRELLKDAVKLQIDAMTISTSDHIHAPVAIQAMKMGIHVYVQKPLVRTLAELKYFNDTAKKYGVVTQMGNQGSSLKGFRRGVEVLNSGILGDIKEVHVWTNRPVWPQGKGAAEATLGPADKIPADFNWDAWLGTAKYRNFKGAYAPGKKGYDPWNLCANVYHPFSWRGFLDFGCGAFGDMACHTMNLPFRGLELRDVTDAECTMIEDATDIAFPMKSIVKLTYAARDSKVRPGVKLPAVTLYWYDGCEKPAASLMPQVIAAQGKVPNTGCIVIGTNGILCSTNDYGGDSFIALKGEEKVVNIKDHPACTVEKIPHTIPYRGDSVAGSASGPGAAAVSADGQYIEFLDGIAGKGPVFASTGSRCYSDVDFSIPIMESILVGVIAQRVPKTKLAWNSAKQTFNNDKANALIKPYVREGFDF